MDIGGGFFRSRRNHCGHLLRTLGGCGQRTGRCFQLVRGGRDGFHDLADRGFKTIGELVHIRLALPRDHLVLPDLFLGFGPGLFLGLDLEAFDRLRHVADLVRAIEPRQHHTEISGGEFLHACGETRQRPNDAACDQEGDHKPEQHGGASDHFLGVDRG